MGYHRLDGSEPEHGREKKNQAMLEQSGKDMEGMEKIVRGYLLLSNEICERRSEAKEVAAAGRRWKKK